MQDDARNDETHVADCGQQKPNDARKHTPRVNLPQAWNQERQKEGDYRRESFSEASPASSCYDGGSKSSSARMCFCAGM